ncbi:mRNA interferase RelE/StbE [Marinobacter sp. es.042]|uniref:type II toxin-antitoxin system RelE family toxin n=1 Tax=Marinobacter sp. es.042 TaxID=1761794 RepID=UPI000B513D77|nr:type II toxin-antitoxin system RelE/ParE family toxin [Marinobacter sp. es.042]SNB54906.1 mRNA interferase RelE/StbE [Marinobacter sp. es.042]
MSFKYSLAFKPSALKEWKKLAPAIRDQFKKKLTKRLEEPHVPADALSGLQDCYKIKLKSVGYRLVYQVENGEVLVTVVAVGRRERGDVYSKATDRT